MFVNLIDCTGIGHTDPNYAARLLVYAKKTRLEQGWQTRAMIAAMAVEELNKELAYIADTIRSSWEFVDYTFEVGKVTRAYTHQQVRTRTASYAQQAQRVADMEAFETLIPQTVINIDGGEAWNDLMRHIAAVYKQYSDAGVPLQDCRGVLPTNVLTSILVKVNLRTLADLVSKRQNLRAQGEYADVVKKMAALSEEEHPWVHPFLYPDRLSTPAIDQILKERLGDKGPLDDPLVNQGLKEMDRVKGVWG